MSVKCMCDLEMRHKRELAATMQIRIYSYQGRSAKGIITFLLDKKEVSFSSLDQMCLIIEEFLDQNEVFEKTRKQRGIGSDAICWSGAEHATMTQMCGCPQKYAVRIYGRQHMSLQGELRTGKKRRYFRSEMELIGLMHQWLRRKFAVFENQTKILDERRICNI